MLIRQKAQAPEDKDWFQFSARLVQVLCSDYVALRLLGQLEPWTTALAVAPKMLDVVEKSLKLFLAVRKQSASALTEAIKYGHNIERLRIECATHSPLFNDADICAFTRDLDDKSGRLYQYMRYGSQPDTRGHVVEYGALPVVDKVFCKSIVLLPEPYRRVLFYGSPIMGLISRSRFDQTQHPEQVLQLLAANNAHFAELAALCVQLKVEQE